MTQTKFTSVKAIKHTNTQICPKKSYHLNKQCDTTDNWQSAHLAVQKVNACPLCEIFSESE